MADARLQVRDFYIELADQLDEQARRDPRVMSESQRVFSGLAASIRRTVAALDAREADNRKGDE